MEGDKCIKGEVEDVEKVIEIKKVDVDSVVEVKKFVKKEDKKEFFRKEKEIIVDGNLVIIELFIFDNLSVVNDRLF